MSTNKTCTNCPGATDHDTAHCPLFLLRGKHPEQAEGAQGEREKFDAWAKVKYPTADRKDSLGAFARDLRKAALEGWKARAALAQPSSAPDHVEQALGMVAPELGLDDQAFDRNAERLTAEAFGTGSGINPQATSIDEATAPELERPEVVAFLMKPDTYETYVGLSRDGTCDCVEPLMIAAAPAQGGE